MNLGMGRNRVREALLELALKPRRLAQSLSLLIPQVASQGITVLAMDGQWLKLVQAEGSPRHRRLSRVCACPIAGKSTAEVEAAFKELCATEELTIRDLLVANPTSLCTVRLFTLPSTDPKEIRDIVELQAEKHTPYAREEITFDFSVIDADPSGYSRVLLIIVHQDVIHRSVHVVERSGAMLERVGCELEGLINWVHLVRAKAGGQSDGEASLLMDVDGGSTTVLALQQGQVRFHRNFAVGAEQLQTEPSQAGERLVNELLRSLEAVEAEGQTGKLAEVLVTGRIERLEGLKEAIERATKLSVRLIAPWEVQELSSAMQEACTRLPDVSFAGLLGLALAPSDVDLTPQATKLHQVFEARARALVLLACQTLAMLVVLTVLMVGRTQQQQRYYERLRQTHQQSERETALIQEQLAQVAVIKQRLRSRGQLLETVQALTRLSPPEIRWKSLTFSRDDAAVLKGVSEVLPKVYEFVAALNQVPPFGIVEAKRVAKQRSEDADLTEFEISCAFPPTQ